MPTTMRIVSIRNASVSAMSEKQDEGRGAGRPTMAELNCLSRILRKAKHRNVADALLKGFMWACWPEWYERNKWEFYNAIEEWSRKKEQADDQR